MDTIEFNNKTDEAYKNFINQIISHEKNEIENKIKLQLKNKYLSQIYRVNVENKNYLQSDECKESEIYNQKLGHYLKCIIEEYSALPYIEREQIFFKESYDKVKQAINEKLLLYVTASNNMHFCVYPFSLETDAMSTRLYLTSLSKEKDSENNQKYPASYRIPNLINIKVLKQSGKLTKEEISKLKKAISNRKVQFLLGDEKEIHVRLTKAGIEKYNSQVYMRPAFIKEKTNGNEYFFYCTERQAENYFFKFGEDAEIISPESLRLWFKDMYKSASMIYEK